MIKIEGSLVQASTEDCVVSLSKTLKSAAQYPNITENLLSEMFSIHQL